MYFIASRRRHTRWPRDWSSDVCSSDLSNPVIGHGLRYRRAQAAHREVVFERNNALAGLLEGVENGRIIEGLQRGDVQKIGRASCSVSQQTVKASVFIEENSNVIERCTA